MGHNFVDLKLVLLRVVSLMLIGVVTACHQSRVYCTEAKEEIQINSVHRVTSISLLTVKTGW